MRDTNKDNASAGDRGASGLCGLGGMSISTGRLVLQPLRVEHAPEMATVLADPELHRFIGGSPDTVEALASRYARWVAGSPDPAVRWWNWVIRLRDEDCLVGTVQATVGPSAQGTVAEVAWVVGVPWQGRGIAGEAAAALVGRLLREVAPTVIAHIRPDHAASAAVATAAGLAPTGAWHDGEVRWQSTAGHRPG